MIKLCGQFRFCFWLQTRICEFFQWPVRGERWDAVCRWPVALADGSGVSAGHKTTAEQVKLLQWSTIKEEARRPVVQHSPSSCCCRFRCSGKWTLSLFCWLNRKAVWSVHRFCTSTLSSVGFCVSTNTANQCETSPGDVDQSDSKPVGAFWFEICSAQCIPLLRLWMAHKRLFTCVHLLATNIQCPLIHCPVNATNCWCCVGFYQANNQSSEQHDTLNGRWYTTRRRHGYRFGQFTFWQVRRLISTWKSC